MENVKRRNVAGFHKAASMEKHGYKLLKENRNMATTRAISHLAHMMVNRKMNFN